MFQAQVFRGIIVTTKDLLTDSCKQEGYGGFRHEVLIANHIPQGLACPGAGLPIRAVAPGTEWVHYALKRGNFPQTDGWVVSNLRAKARVKDGATRVAASIFSCYYE